MIVFALYVAPAPAQESPAAAARLRAFLSEVTTLEARFSQLLIEADSEHTRRSEGRFYLHRPGRFRWDYSSPQPQIVVADGERLWLFDPDLEQVTVRSLDEGISGTPAMLLSGQGRLEDSFRIGPAYAEDGIDWVELAPREEASDFAAVRVGFDAGGLAAMELMDALGQTTVIRFTEVVVNPKLDPALFEFTPPEGADVIRDEGF